MSVEPIVVVAHIPNASPSERIYMHVYFGKSSNTETFSGVPIAKAKENGIYVFRLNVFPFVPFAIKLQRWTTVKMEDRPSTSSASSSLTPDCTSREAAGDGKKESITVLEWQARRIVVEKSWTVIFIEWDQPTRKLLLLSAGEPRYLFAGKYPVQKFPLETSFFVRSSTNNWNAGPRLSEVHEFPPGSGLFWSWLRGSLSSSSSSANEYKMVATIGGNAFGNRTIIVWEPLPFKNKALRPNIPDTFYLLFSDWGDYTDEYKAVDMNKSIIYDSHEDAIDGVDCKMQDRGANPVGIWQRYLSQLAAASSSSPPPPEEEEEASVPLPPTASQASLVTVESVTGVEENEVVFCSTCKAEDLREELERLTRTMEGPGTDVRDTGRRQQLLLLSGSVMTASCPSGECPPSSAAEISNSKDDQRPSDDDDDDDDDDEALETQPPGSGAADGFEASGRAADADKESEEMQDFVLTDTTEYELLGDTDDDDDDDDDDDNDDEDDDVNSENIASVEDILITENIGPDPVQETPTGNNWKLENGAEDKCQEDAKCTEKSNSAEDLQYISAPVPGISEPFVNRLKTGDESKLTPQELDELIDEFADATEAVQMSENELVKLCQKIIDKRRDDDDDDDDDKLQEFDRSDDYDDDFEYEDDDDDYDKPFKRFETYYNRLKTIEEEADTLDEGSSPERGADSCRAVHRSSFLTDTNAQQEENTRLTKDEHGEIEFAFEGSDYSATALTGAADDKLECAETGTALDAQSGSLDNEDAKPSSGHREGIAGGDVVDDCSPYSMPAIPDTLSASELRSVQTVMELYPCDERSYKAFRYFLRKSQTETASCRQCIDRSLLRDIIPFFATGDDDDDDDDPLGSCCAASGKLDRFAGAGGEISGPFDSQQKPRELRGITETQLKCFAQGVELHPTEDDGTCTVGSEDLEEPQQLEDEAAATGRVSGQLSGDADTDISAEPDCPTAYAACVEEEEDAFEMDYNNSSRGPAVRSKRLLKRANSGDRFVIRGEDIDRLDGVEEVKVFRPCVFLSHRFIGQELAFCPSPPPPDYAQFDDSDSPDDNCHVTDGGGTGISWSVREKKLDTADDDDDDDDDDDQLLKSRGREGRSPVDNNKKPCSRNDSQDAWTCLRVTEDEISAVTAPKELPVLAGLALNSAREDTPPGPRSPVPDHLAADSTYDDSFETCRSDVSEPDIECPVDREEEEEEAQRVCQKERFFRVPKCVLNGIVNYESDYDSDTASKFPTVDRPDPIRMPATRLGLKRHSGDERRQFPDDFASLARKSADATAAAAAAAADDDDICNNREGVCYTEDRCPPAAPGTGDACALGNRAQCGDGAAATCPDSISLDEKCHRVHGERSSERTDQCRQDLDGAGQSRDKNPATSFEDDWYLDESEDRTGHSEDRMRTEFRRRRLEEILASDSKFREILERKNFEFSFNQSMDYTLDVGDEEKDKSEEGEEEEDDDDEKLDVRNFAIFPAKTMDFVLEDFDESTGNIEAVDSSVKDRKDPRSAEVFQWDDYMNRPPSPFADDWYADPGQNSFTAFLERSSSAALEDLVRKRTAILEQYHDSVRSGKAAILRRLSVHSTVPGEKELELPSESTFLHGTSSGDQVRRPCEGSGESLDLPCDDPGKLEKAEISEPSEKEAWKEGESPPSVVTTLQEPVSERECVQNLADASDSLQDVLVDDDGGGGGGCHSSEEEGDSKTNSSDHLSVESSSKSTCEKHAADDVIIKDGVSESSLCSEGTDPCPILVPVSSSSELAGAADRWSRFANIEIASDDQRKSRISMLNSESNNSYVNAADEDDSSTTTDVTAGFLVSAAICKAQDNIHANVESTTGLSTENQAHDSDETSDMESLRKEEPENTITQAETVYFS